MEQKGELVSYRPDIKVVDCTLRDGGLVNNFEFSEDLFEETPPNSNNPDLNSDEDLDELRRKLMAPMVAADEEVVTTEYKDEPKDDWVAPKNVMINKEI